MILKEQYTGCNIHQPITGKVINVDTINENDYEHYYNNGYSHLYESLPPVKRNEETPIVEEAVPPVTEEPIEESTNDIPNQ